MLLPPLSEHNGKCSSKLSCWPTDIKPTCVQVEQLTLSPALKAMMLYFLLVFLCHRQINRDAVKSYNITYSLLLGVTGRTTRQSFTVNKWTHRWTHFPWHLNASISMSVCVTHLGTRTVYSVAEELLLPWKTFKIERICLTGQFPPACNRSLTNYSISSLSWLYSSAHPQDQSSPAWTSVTGRVWTVRRNLKNLPEKSWLLVLRDFLRTTIAASTNPIAYTI